MLRWLNDIQLMKTLRTSSILALCVFAVLLLKRAQGEERDRYAQYRVPGHHPPPAAGQTNQTARAKPAEPADKPIKFKELPLNSEFYFLADKDKRLFPRVKISNTSAKSVPTAASPNVTTNPVPAETLVISKKASTDGKDAKKDSGEKGKKP